jgi:nitrogen fixation protein NifU and related proteins
MAPQPYSASVMDHFANPRNVGVIEDADAVGEAGSPAAGRMMQLYLRVNDARIAEARFRTFGCGVAIAASSMLTELVTGKTVAEARTVTACQVSEALGGIPADKAHCPAMAEEVLRAALEDLDRCGGRRRRGAGGR